MLCFLIAMTATGWHETVPALDAKAQVQVASATYKVSNGLYTVNFNAAKYPMIFFNPSQPLDWSKYGKLTMNVTNPGSATVNFVVRIDGSDDHSGNAAHSRYGMGAIEPGKTESFAFALEPVLKESMVRTIPGVQGITWLNSGGGQSDLTHVTRLMVFLPPPSDAATLQISSPQLVSGPALPDGMVDEFGQSTQMDWPDKVHSLDDVKAQLATEQQEIQSSPTAPDRDKWGGSSSLPKLSATGRFHTEQADGRWWLVDPDGGRFFSLGLNQVATSVGTIVTGRERIVGSDTATMRAQTHAPAGVGPTPKADSIDFLGNTLEKLYGANWKEVQISQALDRMKSWGFNTIGNWTSAKVWLRHQMPYVATAQTVFGDFDKLKTGSGGWGPMPDVFDPRWQDNVENCIKPPYDKALGDPYCMGWYIDNELSWHEGSTYSISLDGLRKDGTAPIKKAFVEELKRRYSDPTKLGQAWGTTYNSWDDVAAPLPAAAKPLDADLAALLDTYADKYFHTISAMLHKADPQAIYLGCRFVRFPAYAPQLSKIAARYVDVVSYNFYALDLDPAEWAYTTDLGKPCIISEWHLGAKDTGFAGGIVTVNTQADRAAGYKRYVASVLKLPAFVGCHWFEYDNEPLLGRPSDGENLNDGFITEADTPYTLLVKAARETNYQIYQPR